MIFSFSFQGEFELVVPQIQSLQFPLTWKKLPGLNLYQKKIKLWNNLFLTQLWRNWQRLHFVERKINNSKILVIFEEVIR